MSAHLVELLFFAGIAFFIINKLISVLGNTNDDDPVRNKGFFGESTLKDVTATGASKFVYKSPTNTENIEWHNLICVENKDLILPKIEQLKDKLPNFDVKKFVQSTKFVFELVITQALTNKTNELADLVDPRYLEAALPIASKYGKIISIDKLDSKISDVYVFGNTAFIKVIFTGINITENVQNLSEEWSFSKNLLNTNNKVWFLTNIDKL